MATAKVKAVQRHGEQRLTAIGMYDQKVHFLCFQETADGFRVISFGLRAGRNGGSMKTIEQFWDTTGTEDWTDDDGEVRELNETEIASMTPFANLPEELKASLSQWKDATVVPDPPKKVVSIALSSDVLEKFEANGKGWESKVDDALREWLEEHKAS